MRPYFITLPVAACRDAPVDFPTVALTSHTTEADPDKITLLRGFKCSQKAGLDLAYWPKTSALEVLLYRSAMLKIGIFIMGRNKIQRPPEETRNSRVVN